MAACLLQQHLDAAGVETASAGLTALVGQPIDPTAGEVLAAHGLDASAHRARQATPEILQRADLVLVMETRQRDALRQLAPEATGKVYLLDKWGQSRDVPDPYGRPRDVFERVYRMIEQAIDGWLPYLRHDATPARQVSHG